MFGFLVSKLWAKPEVKSRRPEAVEKTIRWLRDPDTADEWCTGLLADVRGRRCAIGKMLEFGSGEPLFTVASVKFMDSIGFVHSPPRGTGMVFDGHLLATANNNRGRAAAADWLEQRFPH